MQVTQTQQIRRTGRVVMNTREAAFGAVSGYRLTNVHIDKAFDTAAATCRIQFMGWRKGNHNGQAPRNTRDKPFWGKGRWAHISLATYGQLPPQPERWRKGTTDRARYIHADNFQAVEQILGCYGITCQEVIDYWTSGQDLGEDDQITLSLCEIVNTLRPELIATDTLLHADGPHAATRQTAMALV